MKKSTALFAIGLVVFASGVSAYLAVGQNTVDALCSKNEVHHYSVIIKNDQAKVATNLKGKVCDTLTFINADKETRGIAFGPHEDHVPYDGVGEKFLNQGQSFTINLHQIGSFHWHDHMHDEVQGYFSVSK